MNITGLSFVLLLVFATPAFGQADLDLNNIKARINQDGDLFWDFNNQRFEVPQGGPHAIFVANLWIGGLSQGNVLHLAAQTYRQSGTDIFHGPVMNSWEYGAMQDYLWNKVWKLNCSEVDSFAAGLFSSPPTVIGTWPGNGNPGLGQAPTLAPFIDQNNNGVYEPLLGEYPKMLGQQEVYFLYNDDHGPHTESNSTPLKVEIRGTAYEFNCSDPAFDNALFLHYEIFNRSSETYDSTVIGFWADLDLGNGFDDYVGSDSLLNMFYVYNGDNMDESTLNQEGYGLLPPALGVKFLSEPLGSFMNYSNSNTIIGQPTEPNHYYKLMRSRWKDGSTPGTKFMYPGNPGTDSVNTEVSESSPPGARRGVGSIEPFTFPPGSMKSLDLAIIYGRATSGNHLSSVNTLKSRADYVQYHYNQNSTPCGLSFTGNRFETTHVTGKESIFLHPNPTNNAVQLYPSGKVMKAELISIDGRRIKVFSSPDGISEIDLMDYALGIYLLKMEGKDFCAVKKVVKN